MFEDLKDYALEFSVPIIKDEGLEFLLSEIEKNNVKSCLEVGTAIGYSAIRMAYNGVKVTTLERNDLMYQEALKNIEKYAFNEMIKPVFTDALLYTPEETFDLIFIDAAKAQNRKFFLRFTPYLNEGGIVIVDNLNFHGLTEDENIKSRSLRALVRKINEFKDYLKQNEEWDTTFTSMGDGMCVIRKRK